MTYAIELLNADGEVRHRETYSTWFRAIRCRDVIESQIKARARQILVLRDEVHSGVTMPIGDIVGLRLVTPTHEPITQTIGKPTTDTITRRPAPVDFRARACADD